MDAFQPRRLPHRWRAPRHPAFELCGVANHLLAQSADSTDINSAVKPVLYGEFASLVICMLANRQTQTIRDAIITNTIGRAANQQVVDLFKNSHVQN
jgi:hypothetical protein